MTSKLITRSATCAQCGKAFAFIWRGSTRNTCGPECFRLREIEHKTRWRRKRGIKEQKTPRGAATLPRQCTQCGETFTSYRRGAGPHFCSNACHIDSLRIYEDRQSQKRAQRPIDLIRRRKRETTGAEIFDPFDVFERDGWRCHLCHRKTPRSLRGKNADRAPELDHIVPLAAGGRHTQANTACSCRKCNRTKFTKILGQPSLFALL